MVKRTGLILACVALVSCSSGEPQDAAVDRDTLTQRQRDSIFGASSIPGASSVQRALEAADVADDRAARLDSVLRD